jgi:hypothetical protein
MNGEFIGQRVRMPRNDNQAAMPRQYARMGLFIAFLVV